MSVPEGTGNSTSPVSRRSASSIAAAARNSSSIRIAWLPRIFPSKEINARQYTILSQLIDRGQPLSLDELRHAPWYASLYLKCNDNTWQRDLRRLRETGLAHLDTDNTLWPGFITPTNIKPLERKPRS